MEFHNGALCAGFSKGFVIGSLPNPPNPSNPASIRLPPKPEIPIGYL